MDDLPKTPRKILELDDNCRKDRLVCSECGAVVSRRRAADGGSLDYSIEACPACGAVFVR